LTHFSHNPNGHAIPKIQKN
jgi:hypothetical protein